VTSFAIAIDAHARATHGTNEHESGNHCLEQHDKVIEGQRQLVFGEKLQYTLAHFFANRSDGVDRGVRPRDVVDTPGDTPRVRALEFLSLVRSRARGCTITD